MTRTATGAQANFLFIMEDDVTFNQHPEDDPPDDEGNWKVFGTDESFDSQDRDNNVDRLYRPFDRRAFEFLEGVFDGSWSTTFTLTNAWWLWTVYGEPDVDGDTYTFTHESGRSPRSMQIIEEINYPDGEVEQTIYTGAVVSSMDADVAVGDPFEISLDGAYATEHNRSTAEGESLIYGDPSDGIATQPDTNIRALHFANSELLTDIDGDGSVESRSLIQDVSLSHDGNVEMENEIGTRFAVAPSFLNFDFDVSFTRIVNTDEKTGDKRAMYGAPDVNTPQESLDDADVEGEVVVTPGSGELYDYNVQLEGTFPDSFSRNNVADPESVIEEDIDRFVTEIDWVVETDVDDLDDPANSTFV